MQGLGKCKSQGEACERLGCDENCDVKLLLIRWQACAEVESPPLVGTPGGDCSLYLRYPDAHGPPLFPLSEPGQGANRVHPILPSWFLPSWVNLCVPVSREHIMLSSCGQEMPK